MPAKRIAIVGAGITGLTAAYRLSRQGHAVTVLERGAQPGGSVRSIREYGYLIEAGPNSLQYGAPELKALVKELGLEASMLTAGPAGKKRFIVRGGKFEPVPAGPGAFFSTPLFSFGTKVRIFAELLKRPRIRTTDLSLAELVRSHFNQELVDYAVNPLIAGIYAGDPEKLSVKNAFAMLWKAERSHGSLLRGMMALAKEKKARGESTVSPIVSFPDGLQTITDTLAARLPAGALVLGATVETLIPGQPHRLIWKRDGQSASGEFDAVIFAVPAAGLAQLTFGTLAERPFALLDSVVQPPVSSLFLGYRREQVGHPLDGFGGLVPAVERREVLGILFSSSLFPGRAPEGHVGLTVFAGGVRQPDNARLNTPALLRRIEPDLRDLVGVTGEPAFIKHSFWPKAIPQYNLGYERFLEPLIRCEQSHPGVFIGGNVRDGISLPDCLKSGERLAKAAAA
ncbi:MAG: protoporphyrinogen oxidase [Lacunisphaera sp.]|nr:protoporphyrinogen oxidase [Lacunisphaera sp.]